MGSKILIVDDEAPVRHLLTRLLESTGHEVFEADSGERGLVVEEQERPDLVITDLKMPGISGLEMAQQMIEKNPDRPVLMMTAYADMESAREAVRVGLYEYFIKPFDMNDMQAGIGRALEHRRLILENKAYQEDLEYKVEQRTRELAQKVEDLEARDTLLQHLLSIQEPEKTLGLAVKLAAGLCNASFGALYTPTDEGFLLRAAFGFGEEGILEGETLQALDFDKQDMTQNVLEEVAKTRSSRALLDVDPKRRDFGVHSFGVVPVCKGDALIAFLELGRGAKNAPLEVHELSRLESFVPYVAMAVDDCLLQETLPEWDGEVEEVLSTTEKWIDGYE